MSAAEVLAQQVYAHRRHPGRCSCGEHLRAPGDSSHAKHLAAHQLDALKAAGYLVLSVDEFRQNGVGLVELPDAEHDPEWGDEFWPVPVSTHKTDGKVRVDRTYESGPRISTVSVPSPIAVADAPGYAAALLAAHSAANAAETTS